MQDIISLSITCPNEGIITMDGQGIIAYTAGMDNRHFCAIAGQLSIGDIAHLLCELLSTFGTEDVAAALSLAVLHRRSEDEEEDKPD